MHNPTLRVVQILNLFATNPTPLSFSDIARLTGIPKGTLSPILGELTTQRYLRLKSGGLYVLGSAAFRLGAAFVGQMGGFEIIKAHMQEIVDECGETCQFGVLEGGEVLYLHKVESPNPIKLHSYAGKMLPAYCTAIGKALLSDKDSATLRALYPQGLEAFTENTLRDVESLQSELESVRARGVAYERGEHTPEVACAAVPLRSGDEVIAALSVSVPAFRADREKMQAIGALLKRHREQIRKEFGDMLSSDMF